MFAEPDNGFLAVGTAIPSFILQFVERKVDYIMVVEFFRCDFAAQVEPDTMEQLDFLGCQMRSVRAEVEDGLLTLRREDFKRQVWPRSGQLFPGQACDSRFFRHRARRGDAQD